jgi:hypothetical protein
MKSASFAVPAGEKSAQRHAHRPGAGADTRTRGPARHKIGAPDAEELAERERARATSVTDQKRPKRESVWCGLGLHLGARKKPVLMLETAGRAPLLT